MATKKNAASAIIKTVPHNEPSLYSEVTGGCSYSEITNDQLNQFLFSPLFDSNLPSKTSK